jgi:hypothetical protein
VAETALAIAREKADDRRIEVEFAAADAFWLERLGRRFETVLDCGLFHTFDGGERPGYVASLGGHDHDVRHQKLAAGQCHVNRFQHLNVRARGDGRLGESTMQPVGRR